MRRTIINVLALPHLIIFTSTVLTGLLFGQQSVVERVGPGVSAPVIISKTEPQYTEEARRAKVQSTILTKLVIREDGIPSDIRIVRGAGFGLDESAVETIATWRFRPGIKDGRPVPVMSNLEVTFRLLDAARADQTARLTFDPAAPGPRPELRHGLIPENPPGGGNETIRIRLDVNAEGKTENLTVMESTDKKWETRVLHELQSWRFQPPKAGGPVTATFELTHGRAFRPGRAAGVPGGSPGGPDLPALVLVKKGTRELDNGATQYSFSVENFSQYNDELFQPAPDLAPCGRNESASRSWIDIYGDNGARLYWFCALQSATQMQTLWVAAPRGTQPPKSIRVVLMDRRTGRKAEGTLDPF